MGTEHRPFFHAHTAGEDGPEQRHAVGAMPWEPCPGQLTQCWRLLLEATSCSCPSAPTASPWTSGLSAHTKLLLMRREDFLLKLLLFCARVPFLFFRCSFSTAQAIPSPPLGPEVLTSVSAFSFLIFSSIPIRLQCAHSMCSQVASKAEHPIPWLTF